jgi:hypothetical protein
VRAVLLAAVTWLALQLLPPMRTANIDVPPDSATPEQVVRAYVTALNAHDCGTARDLTVPEEWSYSDGWCDDVASLENFDIVGSVSPTPDRVESVGVTFDLDWRFLHGDGSMPEGRTAWGYELQRTSADAPWRIVGQGMG